MNVDAADVRGHYSSLSDEALLDLDPEDLTDVARQVYAVELLHRKLNRPVLPRRIEAEPEALLPVSPELQFSPDHLPWKDNAETAAEFEYAEEAEQARKVLEQASIPCALLGKTDDASLGYRRKYRGNWIILVVPRSSLEVARQRLGAEIFEPSAKRDYKEHFVEFSDDELLGVDTQPLPESGRKSYRAELDRRGLEQKAKRRGADSLPDAADAEDGFIPAAELLEPEARAAIRLLERASVPCRIESDDSQGGIERFAVLVPARYFDQASAVLSQKKAEIFNSV